MAANPALYFAVRNVTFAPTVTGYTVTCYTNNPAHLYLRWTSTIPQKHVNKRIVRGAPVGTYIDQCFVTYTDLEQNEAGDTWTHTFTLDNWTYCQTRWFYFWGTVSGVASPSASCIFKHHSTIYAYMDFYPAQNHGGDSVDGHARRQVPNQTWSQLHDGVGNIADTGLTTLYTGISCYSATDRYDSLLRAILTFPTQTLPPAATIAAAELRLYCTYKGIPSGWNPAAAVYAAALNTYNNIVPADYNNCASYERTNVIPYSSLTVNDHATFTFTDSGLLWINKTAPTELCVREHNYDAANVAPPWIKSTSGGANFHAADSATPTQRPRLRVFYY